MREHLRGLILDISQLDVSISEAVHALLQRYDFPLPDEHIDDDLKPYIPKLNTVLEQLEQLDQIGISALRIKADKETLAGYLAQLKQITDELDQFKPCIAKIKQKLSTLYEQIESADLVAKPDPLAAITKICDTKSQIERVKNLLYQFQLANQEIHLPLWQSQRADLINELRQFGVVAPPDDREGHLLLYDKILSDIDALSNYQYSLELIQQNLAYFITDKNIQDLEDTLPLLQKRLIKKTQSIADFPLSMNLKQLLVQHYEHSFDSHQLHQQKEADISRLQSRFNLNSWYKWMLDYQTYADQIGQHKNELCFIKLLEEQASIQSSIAAAEKSISQFEPSSLKQSTNMTLLETQEKGLKMLDTLKHFGLKIEKLDSLLKEDMDISAADLLIILIESMAHCAHLKDKKIMAKDYLDQIIKLNENIRELQIQFQLVESTANACSAIQEKNPNSPLGNPSCYLEVIVNCQDYLSLIKELNKNAERSRSLEESQKHLKKLIKRKKSAISRQTSTINLPSLLDGISLAIKELMALPPIEEQDFIISNRAEGHSSSSLINHKEEIHYWQCNIQRHYHKMPLHVQTWYKELCEAMLEQLSTPYDYNKACQLLRDIHFELEYSRAKPSPVLLSYHSSCVHPAQALNLLLGMKPAFSPLRENLNQVQDLSIAGTLLLLYEKSEKLKHDHPVEARLLYQATQSIHHAALLVEQDQTHNVQVYSGCILDDPRYERLKRHRGLFFKFWEKIECCSRYLMNKIKGEDMNGLRQCSFFKTQSSKLLLEAETKLSGLRSSIFDQQMEKFNYSR